MCVSMCFTTFVSLTCTDLDGCIQAPTLQLKKKKIFQKINIKNIYITYINKLNNPGPARS